MWMFRWRRKRKRISKEAPNDESSPPKVSLQLVSFTDPTVVDKINDRLDLLSLPPSLTPDNLDRTLKELGRWPAKLSPDDQILYAQHVLPTLIRYFDALYAVDTLERRVDSAFLQTAREQPSFHVVCTIRECMPLAHRPDAPDQRDDHNWLHYHHQILRTLHSLLFSSPTLSFDTAIRDMAATNLSDALVKMALVSKHFTSLGVAYSAFWDSGWKGCLRALEQKKNVQSLSPDALAKVETNLRLIEHMSRMAKAKW